MKAETQNIAELAARASRIGWWHQITLAPGFVTPGVDHSAEKLGYLGLPANLDGKRVLDIGCSDGFFAFEAEKRGAQVTAIDVTRKPGFDFAREVLGSEVRFCLMSVYDLEPALGAFDIVLFLGVYYHLKHPMLALEKVAAVTRGYAIIESEVMLPVSPGAAEARFYEVAYVNGDPTVWWVPNTLCLVQTVRASGFSRVEVWSHYWRTRAVARAVVRAYP